MRYHYTKPDKWEVTTGGVHICNHPMYKRCTLYLDGYLGLAVIQQKFNKKLKIWYWDTIDPWLVDDIFYTPGFGRYFNRHRGSPKCEKLDIYPTVTVRSLMWALRMKPLEREWRESADKARTIVEV